jgi:hypothetical protein
MIVKFLCFARLQLRLDGRREPLREEPEVLRQAFHGLAQRQDFPLLSHVRPDSFFPELSYMSRPQAANASD